VHTALVSQFLMPVLYWCWVPFTGDREVDEGNWHRACELGLVMAERIEAERIHGIPVANKAYFDRVLARARAIGVNI